MEQLKSKEYTSIAKLMRGFLEEIELVPYSELPSPQEIVKELKRRRYLENGITAQQLGCAEDGDQVLLAHDSPNKPPEEVVKILQSPRHEDGDPMAILSFLQTRSQKTHKSRPKKRGLLNWPKQAFPIASRTKKGQKFASARCTLQQKLSRFFPSQFKAGFARPTMILPWNLMLILQRQAL